MNGEYTEASHEIISTSLNGNQLIIPRRLYESIDALTEDFMDVVRFVFNNVEAKPNYGVGYYVNVGDCVGVYSVDFCGFPLEMDEEQRAYAVLERNILKRRRELGEKRKEVMLLFEKWIKVKDVASKAQNVD